ncbi:MAG TPA: type II CAAX endopeptidase family protein [Pirellulales bacterium]|nr:type II CAAX endopeptidase family protein [Pirellulales bacterium]
MSAEQPSLDSEPPVTGGPRVRGRPLIAWCVIVGVASFVAWQNARPHPRAVKAHETVDHRLAGSIADWQVRYMVGAARTFPKKESEQFAAVAPVGAGPIEQRLRGVIAVGEISGPKAAAEKLKNLEEALDEQHANAESRKTAESLELLYGDLAEGKSMLPSLGAADRERLTARLGWSGRLALHPAGAGDANVREGLLWEARRTFAWSVILIVIFGVLALGGLGALLTIVVILLSRPKPTMPAAPTPRGGIYAETFAMWIVLYIALSYAAAWLGAGHNRLLLTSAVMLASLAALGWPMLRGIGWSVARDELGLHFGRRPLVEIVLGLVAYLAALPLVAVGVAMVLALLALQRRWTGDAGVEFGQNLPTHPIVGWLLDSDWWEKLQVVFLASVMAPLMEETMFRGVLYRHLRDATCRFGYAVSVLVSGLAVSFLFAVIHPQGWIAVPVLMALALAFALVREWRGTLLPAMLAHGINNFLATCVLIWIG